MSNLASAKLFVRVAVLRRRAILRQSIGRAIAGALAVASFIVAAGFATYALFLAIRVPLGELGAVAAMAALYLVIALGLLVYTLREPASPELDALAEMESAALDTLLADSHGMIQSFTAAGHRMESLGNTVSLGLSVLSALRRLMSAKREEKSEA
jgi:hypothetical protein